MIEAIGYMGDMDDGVSKPKRMLCSDNIMRVIKFNHPEEFNRALLHEFLCFRLAKLLDLPVLDQVFVYISEELAGMYSNVEGMTPGIKVGSPLVNIDKNIADNGLFREPLHKLYASCKNKDMIQDILAYDIWIHNNDRGSNDGNLLVIPDKDSSRNLVLHDHGYAFFQPAATMDRYKYLQAFREAHLTWQDHLFPFGPVYEAIKMNVNLTDISFNPFIGIIKRIEGVLKEELEEIINDIPEEWNIPEYEKNAIVSFLFERKYKIRECIDRLVRMWWFPNWNGGELSWEDLYASSE